MQNLTPSQQRIVDRAFRILEKRALYDRSVKFSDPTSARSYLKLRLHNVEREEFHVMFFNTQHELLAAEILGVGTLDAASVYPREVIKAALKHNAAAVVFAHNHPSSNPEPSSADRVLTDRLKQALALIDIRTLDHFVVGGNEIVSFAERGWL